MAKSSTYGAYLFRAKDPAIDELRTVLEDYYGRRITKKDAREIEHKGGPKAATVNAWFFGKTQRPQSASLEACGRSAGFARRWVKMKEGK